MILRKYPRTEDSGIERTAAILTAKFGISNHAALAIFYDLCLSKFGALPGLCPQVADNFRTFVCVPYGHQTTGGVNATFMSNKT